MAEVIGKRNFDQLTLDDNTVLTDASSIGDLGNVVLTSPASNEILKYNGTNWVNSATGGGVAAASTLASWTLDSGDLYYATFNHALSSTDVILFCYNTVTDMQAFPEDVEIVDTNNVKVWVRGNTHSLRVTAITGSGAVGPQGEQGPAGGGMANVVEDTTPQLGGDLDRNGNTITGYTSSRALVTGGTGGIQVSAVTDTEIGYLDGVTSAIQTQLNGKTSTGHAHTESDITDLGSYIENVVEDTTPQLGGDLDLNQKYVEFDPTPTSDHTGNGIMATMQVDVNSVGVRAALHLDTDGNFILADADAATTMPCMALAIESGTGSKKVLLQGFYRDDTWNWTVGGPIYVSTTGGNLTQTAPSGTGDQVQRVGIATHADRIWFNPDLTVIEIT